MATIRKTKSGKWQVIIRRTGWPKLTKTYRIKRDAEDWARVTEDEIIRGIYLPRNHSEKLTITKALSRYTKEVTPTKRATTQKRELVCAKQVKSELGQYSMAALNAEIIANYRDKRLNEGKSSNTVRLELALLSHLFSATSSQPPLLSHLFSATSSQPQ